MQTSVCLEPQIYPPLHPTPPTSSHHNTHLIPSQHPPSQQSEVGRQ